MDMIEMYEEWLVRLDFSPNTVKRYGSTVRLFFREVGKQPADITDVEVRAFRDKRHHLHRPGRSINTYMLSVRSFFRWMIDTGQRQDDPTEAVHLLSEQIRIAPKALSADQEALLLETVRQQQAVWQRIPPRRFAPSRDLALVVLMSKAGLRIHEALGLLKGDFSMNGGGQPSSIQVWGKGRKVRDVPLGHEARAVVGVYLAEIGAAKLPDEAPIFRSCSTGRPLTVSQGWRIVTRYAALAGVHCSPHILRHTFGTRVLRDMGVDVVTVAQLMGHESIETTRRYTRPTEEGLRQAVEKL
jgi:site-specific recombinase XerD